MLYCVALFVVSYVVHVHCMYVQDAHVVVPDYDDSTALLAVFDGHGGWLRHTHMHTYMYMYTHVQMYIHVHCMYM